jgi:hypothetical protein
MSEADYEVEPDVGEPAAPEFQDWEVYEAMAEYANQPDEEEALRAELAREEQLDQFRAAVDERLEPLNKWVQGIEAARATQEGEALAERIVNDLAEKHGVQLDAGKIMAEADEWLMSNRGDMIQKLVQSGVDPAQAEAIAYSPDAARATLDWFALQAIPAKDEMALLGRYMGQNVGGGRPTPTGINGDEMNVVRKHFPKG